MLYVLIEKDDYRVVKLGTTVNLKQRLRDLQTGNYRELQIVAVLDGDATTEALLKLQFKEYRLNREWFNLEGELLEFLRPHLFSYRNPKLISVCNCPK
jgi:hypothetical protein